MPQWCRRRTTDGPDSLAHETAVLHLSFWAVIAAATPGPVPGVVVSERLRNTYPVRVPKDIPEEAADYWRRNAPLCSKMGTLTDADYHAFLSVCLTWAKYIQCVNNPASHPNSVVALSRTLMSMQARFGLDPASRKKLGIDLDDEKTWTSCSASKLKMPHRPKRLTPQGHHTPPRGTTTERGYGSEWQRIRLFVLSEHPTCQLRLSPTCTGWSQHVHHTLPLSRGGTHDTSNLLACCFACHMRWHKEHK
jgi:5-methylcytosine-specific restriction protein A